MRKRSKHSIMDKIRNYYFYVICILYNIFMLFYQRVPNIFVAFISLAFIFFLYFNLKKKYNHFEILFLAMILLVPTSFVSILGTPYGQLPLSWFSTITIILFMSILLKGKIDQLYFITFLIYVAYSVFTLFYTLDIFDASKQILTIILFLLCFIIGEFLRGFNNRDFSINIKRFYILGVLAFSMSIFVQRFFIESTGVVIGHFGTWASRISYAGLMSDYSFASLYVASGAVLLLIIYFETKSINPFNFLLVEIIFLLSILLINSRTGLVSLFIVMILYSVRKIFNGNLKALFMMIIFLLIIPVIAIDFINNRGGQSFLDGSGRVETYFSALSIFSENPIVGIGFGLNNLVNLTGVGVPHNLIIQYLLQSGILGVVFFFSNFVIFFLRSIRKTNNMRFLLYTVLIGTMFIPDIPSSRYLSVIIIMVIINSNRVMKKNERSEL